ncbi:MAG: hypothetical protein ABR601_09005 [Parasphingopyxis sp.]
MTDTPPDCPDRSEAPAPEPHADAPLPANQREDAAGWTTERIRLFLVLLAESGNVVRVCDQLMISRQAAYQLRRRRPAFAFAWDGAILRHRDSLVDACMDRALYGVSEEVAVDGQMVERVRADGATLRFMMARADRLAESRELHDRPARLAEARLEDLMDLLDPPEQDEAPHPDRRRFDARAAYDLLDDIAESAMPDWDERFADRLDARASAAREASKKAQLARREAEEAREEAERTGGPHLPLPEIGDPELEAQLLSEEERGRLSYLRWHRALMAMPPEMVDVSDLDPAEAFESWDQQDWDRAFHSGLVDQVDFSAAEEEDEEEDEGGDDPSPVKQV